MARVLWMSTLSRHLVMMKSIICQCLERGCIQVVLHSSFCLNMVFVTISSNSEHRASRSSPLELHFPIPCLPMTTDHLSFSLPILALKSSIKHELICTVDATEHTCQLVVEGLLVFIWVCHFWSVHADNLAKLSLHRGSLIVMILLLTGRGISVSFVTISFLFL